MTDLAAIQSLQQAIEQNTAEVRALREMLCPEIKKTETMRRKSAESAELKRAASAFNKKISG